MYTSGCPKNQNKCWYKIGSPPPIGSKNVVFKLRSVRSIVIAPARTGSESSKSTVVTKIDQTNNGVLLRVIPSIRIFIIVVMKLIAPKIEEAPAKWRLKIVKSTEGPPCARFADKGG